MKSVVTGSACLATVFTFGLVGFGQEPTQPPQPRSSADQQVTITGCVTREADYRQARDAGRGGVAGTGVGAGNEFVLTNASMSTGPAAGARPSADPASPTGTTGSAATAYELTGPNEGQVSQYVGRRVEITGKLKAAESGPTGQPTGGATAGQPPTGVDVASKDLKLRELEVSSVRESSGTCPAAK
jgi:hypothetical protein